jgi:hypothetical protein
MVRQPDFVKDDQKPIKPKTEDQKTEDQKAEDQSHKPAKHIEETARLASSVEKAKNPGKVRGAKD